MRRRLLRFMTALWVIVSLLSMQSCPAQESPVFTPPPNLPQLRAQYNLSSEAEKMLLQNGFLVLDQVHYKCLEDAYPLQHHIKPMFVTTDAMLELWSSLNRELLKSTEKQVFIKQLSDLLPTLEKSAKRLWAISHGPGERKALRQVVITIAVAHRLLIETSRSEGYSPSIRAEIEAQVQKVMQHQEASEYPGEDYTQYTVRGHYAADPALSRYFRASMWLSRRFFAVTPEPGPDPDAPLRAAIACAAVVRAASPTAREALVGVTALRQTLAGSPDAISIPQLLAALDRVSGDGWNLAKALQPSSLAALRRELTRPIYPVSQVRTRIVNQMGTPYPKQTAALLPGIASPDSVLFRQTVHPEIKHRSLPTGLEVAASLGSEVARREIEQKEGARAGKVLAAVDRFGAHLKADEGATIYSGWLQALSTLSAVPTGAPAFMRNRSWQYEKLNTTLASWAQLRHNFILYAEQNYAMDLGMQMAAPALVEANPAFYQAMAQLAGRTLKVLKTVGGMDAKSEKALSGYEAKCREFEGYARAELAGTLTHQQSVEIDKFCDWLDRVYASSTAALVADVATGVDETGKMEVLHVATGDMNTLLVIPDPKTGVVYTGATTSYYEFAQPGLDRLTDARWQAQQAQTYLRPDRPSWASAFIAHEAGSEWAAREPLRAAEKLLNENRAEEALALLRATVEKNPDTTLATESQFRLGRYYLDQHDFPRAEKELQRCERLPGCAAFDQAQEQLRQVKAQQQYQDYQQRVAAPARNKALVLLNRLRDVVKTLKRMQPDANREHLAAEQLIRALPWEEGRGEWRTEVVALLKSAVTAFRTRPWQDAIGYALLVAERGGRFSTGSLEQAKSEFAYFHQAASPPLRAAALGMALQDGRFADQPKQALELLKPFLDAHLLDHNDDPALKLVLTPPDQSFSIQPDPISAMRENPTDLFRDALKKVLATLSSAALDAGQIKQAIDYAQLFPFQQSGDLDGDDFQLGNVIQRYGSIQEADLPAASMLAVEEGLEGKNKTEEAVRQALALVQRYPHSCFAPVALCNAIQMLRREPDAGLEIESAAVPVVSNAKDETKASKLKTILSQQYPDSFPALCIQIETAFNRGDLERARRLLVDYEKKSKGDDSSLRYSQDPVGVSWIESRLSQYDQLVQQLKPLLEAAKDPDLARMDRLETNGEPLAEALVKKLPDRAAEIYLTLSKVYQNPALTMRFLERFPSDPQAGEVWKRLLGNERVVTPGALNGGGPETVEWLAPFVNRKDANSDTAAMLLKKTIANSYGDMGVRIAEEEAQIVQGRYPYSRAAYVADLAVAQLLLNNRRPEAMLTYADRAAAGLQKDDPFHLEVEQLHQRAVQEIAAKHRQDWSPLWEATLRMEDAKFISEPPAPVADAGLLFASEPDEGGKRQLTALEAAAGARKWTSRLDASLIDFVAPQGGRHLFCVLENGEVAAVDRKTGAKVWRKKVLSGQEGEHLDGIVAAGRTVVVYGSKVDRRFQRTDDDQVGVIGLSPLDGHTIWRHTDWHLPRIGRTVEGKPAVFKEKIVVALDPARLVAFRPDTGAVIWEHPYPKPAPLDPNARIRRQRPTLLFQPQTFEEDRVLIFTFRPTVHYDLLDGKTGAVLKTIEMMRSMTMSRAYAAKGYFLEWDMNGGSSVRRTSDFSTLPSHIGLRMVRESPAIAERIVYVCDPQNTKLLAVDLETGATLGSGAASGADFGAKVVLGEGRVFVVGFNGKTTCFPLFSR